MANLLTRGSWLQLKYCRKCPPWGRMMNQGSEESQLPHLLLAPKALSLYQSSVLTAGAGQGVWGRQIVQPESLPSCGAEPAGWISPHMPVAPLAEVTLGLRNTPIRITTIPSSVSSICNISSVSSNVTKVSTQGVLWGCAPPSCCLAAPGLGVGTRDQGVSVGSMLCLFLVDAFVLVGFFSSRDPGLGVWLHSPT